jgi:TetR/AcrR family transcriptional regulator, transcriptional repressor of bet genes
MNKPLRKPRTTIEDLRRREIIQAAHRVFMQHGLGGLTTQRICAEAGLSPGILTYYFKGKDEVLFAMVRLNNRILSQDVAVRLRAANTPWARLVAIVEGNFPEGVYTPTVAAAWLSLCAESGQRPPFRRLQQIFYARLRSNIAAALGPDVPDALTMTIAAMIDGFWLRRATDNGLTSATVVALILQAVERQLGAKARDRMDFARR